MKRSIKYIVFAVAISLTSCGGNKGEIPADVIQNGASAANPDKKINGNEPIIVFKEKEKSFGDVEEGTVVEMFFSFTNKGKSDLVISNVTAGCSCTVPEWPKKPVKPGEEGVIKAVFNSENKGTGKQGKSVYVYSNATEQVVELTFSGNLTEKKN